MCECGPGGDRCDAVSGCVCLSGWTGENCDEDVDECTTDPFICGSNRVCKNLEGSYLCGCEDGFQLMADKCEGELRNIVKMFRFFFYLYNLLFIMYSLLYTSIIFYISTYNRYWWMLWFELERLSVSYFIGGYFLNLLKFYLFCRHKKQIRHSAWLLKVYTGLTI